MSSPPKPRGLMRLSTFSVSAVHIQTPVYVVRPRIQGWCIAWCASLSSSFCRYQFIPLGNRGT